MDPTPTPTPRCAHALATLDLARGRRACALCHADVVPRVRVTFEIVTPESAEDGDTAETGWIDEIGTTFDASDTDDDEPSIGTAVARFITRAGGHVEPSDWPPEVTPHRAPWFTQSDPDRDFRTGAEERHSYHVEGLTADEWRDLFVALR